MSDNKTLIALFEQHAGQLESEHGSSGDPQMIRIHDQCARKLRRWAEALHLRDPEKHEFLLSGTTLRTGDIKTTMTALRKQASVLLQSDIVPVHPTIWHRATETLNKWETSLLRAVDRRTTLKY